MRSRSIELLMAEINEIVRYPNMETLRVSVILNVRYVLRSIGVEFTCQYIDDQIVTVKDRKLQIPEDVVLIDNFGFPNGSWNGARMGHLQNYGTKLTYRETPFEIIFPFFKEGDLVMRCYKMYTDEEGMPVIPEAAYEACVHWCKYKALDARADQSTELWRSRFTEMNLAKQEIYYARSHFNTLTTASQKNTDNAFTKGANFY